MSASGVRNISRSGDVNPHIKTLTRESVSGIATRPWMSLWRRGAQVSTLHPPPRLRAECGDNIHERLPHGEGQGNLHAGHIGNSRCTRMRDNDRACPLSFNPLSKSAAHRRDYGGAGPRAGARPSALLFVLPGMNIAQERLLAIFAATIIALVAQPVRWG